ncbi:helix-turn-helix transcriptional regulator [Stakelama sediminis]|uniref:Transcriptional regulator with XRE-family HTH domain n=1 Tax=Stakelama sediminis TaxID=463200 RepID=A0A840Z2M2_9SPHN|nr:helix-turn-helix transcriptional regulator [Stakelama sediminis]MBB5720049.1 transcriptional regulator with XRE-family HTH domain [Stakelama sediminis]
MINWIMASSSDPNPLGDYLKDRRARLDPAVFGLPASRRRTPGLRREEVAQRAHISTTWYTWLEQGRGGAPSADTLNRIARALMLTDVEREHLFLLALGRLPERRYRESEGVTPRLQRVLDAMSYCPAIIKTAGWDVVAWNRAAAAVLTDYGKLPPDQRNILRLIFCDPRVRAHQFDWESVARGVVGAFRVDTLRAGASEKVAPLVEELCRTSPEFAALWQEHDLLHHHGEGTKRIRHPELGTVTIEFSTFAVDGRPDLGMLVYNPATPEDAEKLRTIMEETPDMPAR